MLLCLCVLHWACARLAMSSAETSDTPQELLSDMKLCAEPSCSTIMCQAKALQQFTAQNCLYITLKVGSVVHVYHKLVGRNDSLWAGSVGKQFGYFPKKIIDTSKCFTKMEVELPTEEKDFICVLAEDGIKKKRVQHSRTATSVVEPNDLDESDESTKTIELQDQVRKAGIVEGLLTSPQSLLGGFGWLSYQDKIKNAEEHVVEVVQQQGDESHVLSEHSDVKSNVDFASNSNGQGSHKTDPIISESNKWSNYLNARILIDTFRWPNHKESEKTVEEMQIIHVQSSETENHVSKEETLMNKVNGWVVDQADSKYEKYDQALEPPLEQDVVDELQAQHDVMSTKIQAADAVKEMDQLQISWLGSSLSRIWSDAKERFGVEKTNHHSQRIGDYREMKPHLSFEKEADSPFQKSAAKMSAMLLTEDAGGVGETGDHAKTDGETGGGHGKIVDNHGITGGGEATHRLVETMTNIAETHGEMEDSHDDNDIGPAEIDGETGVHYKTYGETEKDHVENQDDHGETNGLEETDDSHSEAEKNHGVTHGHSETYYGHGKTNGQDIAEDGQGTTPSHAESSETWSSYGETEDDHSRTEGVALTDVSHSKADDDHGKTVNGQDKTVHDHGETDCHGETNGHDEIEGNHRETSGEGDGDTEGNHSETDGDYNKSGGEYECSQSEHEHGETTGGRIDFEETDRQIGENDYGHNKRDGTYSEIEHDGCGGYNGTDSNGAGDGHDETDSDHIESKVGEIESCKKKNFIKVIRIVNTLLADFPKHRNRLETDNLVVDHSQHPPNGLEAREERDIHKKHFLPTDDSSKRTDYSIASLKTKIGLTEEKTKIAHIMKKTIDEQETNNENGVRENPKDVPERKSTAIVNIISPLMEEHGTEITLAKNSVKETSIVTDTTMEGSTGHLEQSSTESDVNMIEREATTYYEDSKTINDALKNNILEMEEEYFEPSLIHPETNVEHIEDAERFGVLRSYVSDAGVERLLLLLDQSEMEKISFHLKRLEKGPFSLEVVDNFEEVLLESLRDALDREGGSLLDVDDMDLLNDIQNIMQVVRWRLLQLKLDSQTRIAMSAPCEGRATCEQVTQTSFDYLSNGHQKSQDTVEANYLSTVQLTIMEIDKVLVSTFDLMVQSAQPFTKQVIPWLEEYLPFSIEDSGSILKALLLGSLVLLILYFWKICVQFKMKCTLRKEKQLASTILTAIKRKTTLAEEIEICKRNLMEKHDVIEHLLKVQDSVKFSHHQQKEILDDLGLTMERLQCELESKVEEREEMRDRCNKQHEMMMKIRTDMEEIVKESTGLQIELAKIEQKVSDPSGDCKTLQASLIDITEKNGCCKAEVRQLGDRVVALTNHSEELENQLRVEQEMSHCLNSSVACKEDERKVLAGYLIDLQAEITTVKTNGPTICTMDKGNFFSSCHCCNPE
uniref:SH3 domain-containing protein n=1 Tax=Eptatretus burgeri TaxID=7764 RepID=A0A8C4NIZ2_EPTBU